MTGLTWIKGIVDNCGFFTLSLEENPDLVLTAESSNTLTIEQYEKKWKLTDGMVITVVDFHCDIGEIQKLFHPIENPKIDFYIL